jgi:hypothetical protein
MEPLVLCEVIATHLRKEGIVNNLDEPDESDHRQCGGAVKK